MRLIPTLVAVLCTTLLFGACTSPPTEEEPGGEGAEGCGECTAQLEAVRDEITALAGVASLMTLKLVPGSPTNAVTVDVEATSDMPADPALVDEIARIVWQSEVTPVEVVTIVVKDPSNTLEHGSSPYNFRDTESQYGTYVERWGPRPVE